MSHARRLTIFAIGMLSLLGGAAATAGAVTWHNTGSTAFTATSGAQTLGSTTTSLNCLGATATGDVPVGSTVNTVLRASGTVTYSGCSIAGINTGVDCSYTLTASTQSGSQVTGDVDLTCGWYQFGTRICHAAGSVHAIYTNPVAGVGTLTLTTGGNLIALSPGTGFTCPLGNGDRTHVAETTFRTTSANPPIITRTA